ncbi:MAG: hypothetical protein LYZ69_09440 [Nitrososphaerales archaeon]|nr:hypothetical protein [Nitrososphaerales archaeon]
MSILAEPLEEAKRIFETSAQRGVVLRLLGGIAVRIRCPSTQHAALKRRYLDLDFIGLSKQSGDIREFFEEIGYEPRVRFNAMMGSRRLIFNDLVNERRVDIFLDVFEMCHKFDFRERVRLDPYTLPLADLLATKLQIVQINDKDFRDVVSLLMDHEVGKGDGDMINGPYIAGLCSNDWGVYKTFTMNLSKVLNAVEGYGLSSPEVAVVKSKVEGLVRMIEGVPKTLSWKLRARVGERVPWYELPEGDKLVVTDSG